MFCGECGAKNEKNSAFCSECGAPLEHDSEKQEVTTKVVKKEKKPISKKNKIIIGVVILIVLILGIGYKVGDTLTSPKNVADDYIKAIVNSDGNALYKYLDLEGDKTFISKEVFNELLKNNSLLTSEVENYKITDVKYGDGKLTATVTFTYTLKDSSSEKTSSVKLTKQKKKKFLVFDNWEVSDSAVSQATVENYKIKVTKDSKLTFAGVEVSNKYLSKEDSTDTLDVYVLPQVFASKTTVKAVLPSGLEIEESITPSSYYSSHTVSFDEDSLTDSAKEKILTKAKEYLTTIYTNAIAKNEFDTFKSSFEHGSLDLTNLNTSYTSFLSDLESSSNTLTSITFTDLSIYDIELTNDGYLEVEVKANYDYEVKYTSWNDEEKTNSSDDYSYMTLVLTYDNNEYYLVDVDDLEDYFSRY